jgi:hypothetical protein
MLKLALLIICFAFVGVSAYSQQLIKGRVLENGSRIALVSINVQNLSTKQSAVTDNNGKFTIKANINDLLVFKGFAYRNDTLLITRYNDIEVFLLPLQHVLNDVKVTSMDGPAMSFYDPYFHGQTTAYQTDANGNFKGGVNFRIWYWKKDERKKKKLAKMLHDEEVRSRIANLFSAKNLASLVPLQGAEMEAFIRLFTPSLKVFEENSFFLPDYVNASYKKFIQLPPEKRIVSTDLGLLKQ